MQTKCQTIDEICGKPPGSFKKFIEEHDEILRQHEADQRARIKAYKEGKPLPDFTPISEEEAARQLAILS